MKKLGLVKATVSWDSGAVIFDDIPFYYSDKNIIDKTLTHLGILAIYVKNATVVRENYNG